MTENTTIACCQIEPIVGEKKNNLEKIINFASEAAKNGAKVIILPELSDSGYVFKTRMEAYSIADQIPQSETIQTIESFTKKNEVFLAVGILEKSNNSLYNSSILLGPNGYIGKYRKLHLWNKEKLVFEKGNLGLPTFNTSIGRMAMYICNDMWFPETTRIFSLLGADIILNSPNWIGSGKSDSAEKIVQAICVSNAHQNAIYLASANRIGTERGQYFIGNSMIVHPSGKIIAGPATSDKEEIIYSTCNLSDSRVYKTKTSLDNLLGDRRRDIYDEFLGYRQGYENGKIQV